MAGEEPPRAWKVNQDSTVSNVDPKMLGYANRKITIGPMGHQLVIDQTTHRAVISSPSGASPRHDAALREEIKWPWAFSPNGQWLAASGKDGNPLLWKIKEGLPISVESHFKSGSRLPITTLAFSLGGNWLAFGDASGKSSVWNLQNPDSPPKSLTNHLNGRVTAIAFSRDGRNVATAGEDGKVYIRRLTDTTVSESDLSDAPRPGRSSVEALAFGPQDWLAISYVYDGVLLWRRDHTPVHLEHSWSGTPVSVLIFGPRNDWLAGITDRGYELWSFQGADTPPVPLILNLPSPTLSEATFSSDGNEFISYDNLGKVLRWDLRPEMLLKGACMAAGRNLTEKEWKVYIPSEPYQEREPCPKFPKAYD